MYVGVVTVAAARNRENMRNYPNAYRGTAATQAVSVSRLYTSAVVFDYRRHGHMITPIAYVDSIEDIEHGEIRNR